MTEEEFKKEFDALWNREEKRILKKKTIIWFVIGLVILLIGFCVALITKF